MEWLPSTVLNGSSSRGHYQGRYGDHRTWDEPRYSDDDSSGFDKEEIDHAIALSLSEVDEKGKKVIENESDSEEVVQWIKFNSSVEDELDEYERRAKAQQDEHVQWIKFDNSDEDELDEYERRAKAQQDEDVQWIKFDDSDEDVLDEYERRAIAQQEEDERRARALLEDDEQLAMAIQESLRVASPPRICAGCNTEIGHGRSWTRMGAVWHPDCFRCHACNLPITDDEFSTSGDHPYHKYCYKVSTHPKCDVCQNFIPANSVGLVEYRAHPFWLQKYCPSHERDGTPRCCSCERMEPKNTKYLSLDDGRKLCLECLDSAIMDTHECQPLYLEILEFYEGLNMKVEQQVPLLLVERSALNEAMDGEKNGHHHLPETRGLCLSEEQTVTTVRRRPKIGAGHRLIGTITEPYRLIRRCEVTAILILYGLPRLLTGSILAHEIMHAWLRLKGYPNLKPEVEEGICQVLAHMWLESEIYAGSASHVASTSSSSSSSKKGKRSDFEKDLGKFFKDQIESDTSSAYGDGFREGNKAVNEHGLKRTLKNILLTGSFP